MLLAPSRRPLLIALPCAALLAVLVYFVRAPHPSASVPAPVIAASAPVDTEMQSRLTTLLSDARLPDPQDFLQRWLPAILKENTTIEVKRRHLEDIATIYLQQGEINEADFNWIKALAAEYQLKPQRRTDSHFFDELLARVDVVPTSLALAQAALESGTGASYSVHGTNNLFNPGCQKIFCTAPTPDPHGSRFRTVPGEAQSMHQYFLRLNTHPAYSDFRDLRASLRQQFHKPDGMTLAAALQHDSILGARHVDALRRIITLNNFDALD